MADRLLIVDDDPDFAAIVAAVAKSAGYEVLEITVSTKFEGALRSWSPTHVVVDMNMPEIDGVEALQILKRHSSGATVIICSATQRSFLDAVHALGGRWGLVMADVIQKPIRPKELKHFLEHVAGRSEPTAIADHILDTDIFEGVRGAMGCEWMIKGLAQLISEIDTTLGKQYLALVDREQLARGLPALAAYAGMFGFSEFSQLCREVDEAKKRNKDFEVTWRQAQNASRSVCVKAREVIVCLADGSRIDPAGSRPARIRESLPAILPG